MFTPPEPPLPRDVPSHFPDDRAAINALLRRWAVTETRIAEFNEPFIARILTSAVEDVAASSIEYNVSAVDASEIAFATSKRPQRFYVRAYDADNQFVREIGVLAHDADGALQKAIRQRFSNEVLFDLPFVANDGE